MQKVLPSILLFCFTTVATAISQNLVINPGLENYITCPGFGQFGNTYINNWTKPSWGSTDYYHANCPGILPINQTPHGGSAYFGIIAYNYGTEYREYATAELSTPLTAGLDYYVEFFVSLNDGYIQAINEIGGYLSATAPGPFANSLHIAVTPQIVNSSGTLGNSLNWVPVSGIFTAAGGEQYITIGNFNPDSLTTIAQVGTTGSYGAYYFVDDVNVTLAESISSADNNAITVYPSSDNNEIKIRFAKSEGRHFVCTLHDCTGRILKSEDLIINSTDYIHTITIENIQEGIYFLSLIDQEGIKHILKFIH